MQFLSYTRSAMLLACLIAVGQSAPVTSADLDTTAALAIDERTIHSRTNECGDSTFSGASSNASPLVSDCQQLARNIAGGGRWEITTGIQETIARYGTCAFGVSGRSGWFTYVGNEDVIDLIRDSIARFQWFGKVGAKGEMECGPVDVYWGIYHT